MGTNKRYPPAQFAYSIEEWSDGEESSIIATLAQANHLLIARGAYNAACEVHPRALVLLRQGARVVEKSKD